MPYNLCQVVSEKSCQKSGVTKCTNPRNTIIIIQSRLFKFIHDWFSDQCRPVLLVYHYYFPTDADFPRLLILSKLPSFRAIRALIASQPKASCFLTFSCYLYLILRYYGFDILEQVCYRYNAGRRYCLRNIMRTSLNPALSLLLLFSHGC